MSKNIFTDYLPVSAAIYMDDNGIDVKYVRVGDSETGQMSLGDDESGLVISERSFKDVIGIQSDLGEINWKHEAHMDGFDSSFKAPGIDLVVEEDGDF